MCVGNQKNFSKAVCDVQGAVEVVAIFPFLFGQLSSGVNSPFTRLG